MNQNNTKLESNTFRTCHGCGAPFAYQEAPTNRYGVASPECWQTFTETLGKEQEWAGYPPIHRLLIDAYSVQHPSHSDIQKKLGIPQRLIDASKQSVVIHLIALYLAFEKKIPLQNISKQIADVLETGVKLELLELKPPTHLGDLTIIDIHKASDFNEYETLIYKWAQSIWNAWKPYHGMIQQWYEKYRANTSR